MNRLPLTKLASQALEQGRDIGKYLGFRDISSVFLLYGLFQVKECMASEILAMHGVTDDKIEEFLKEKAMLPRDGRRRTLMTPKCEEILSLSAQVAIKYHCDAIGTEHILMAIIEEGTNEGLNFLLKYKIPVEGIYTDILITAGMDYKSAKAEFQHAMQGDGEDQEEGRESMLKQFSVDLTLRAQEGQLDPMIGREEEMERLLEVLCRRTKNNPCLIGDPGVGKTAMVEGLAQMMVEGRVPYMLKGKRLLNLDLTRVIAGTKYRGEFEERMKQIIEEVTRDTSVVLFIDEIHTMIGAGGSEGAMDASNILKPALARGDFQLIGATTNEEYTKYFEKDAALERRFQPVRIDEPTVQETIHILDGLKYRFEEYHKMMISEEVVRELVELANRYIQDRFLPDKAIDLMDEACARKRMGLLKQTKDTRKERKEVKRLVDQIEHELFQGNVEQAKKLKKEKEVLERKIRRYTPDPEKQKEVPQLSQEDVAKVISLWTKIPTAQLEKGDMERLRHLEKELHKTVIGQDEAVKAVARAVKRSRIGLKDPKRPIGSFLFLGPTGVGKTELSKTLAKAMFGREEDLIRVDMSEYMEKHSVSKIIGSPPGYVGFGEGGQLSEQIRRHPYSVLLFDEIEKAHPDVFNILLQVLDDGHITDSNGRKIDFKNTVIIMTSNAGANRIVSPKRLGFAATEDKEKDHLRMKEEVMDEIKQIFKPEFLNRIDETVVFASLNQEEIGRITKLFIKELSQRIKKEQDITLKVTPAAISYLVEKGFNPTYGARPLRRLIQNDIEDVIADMILEEELSSGVTLSVGRKDKKLTFSIK